MPRQCMHKLLQAMASNRPSMVPLPRAIPPRVTPPRDTHSMGSSSSTHPRGTRLSSTTRVSFLSYVCLSFMAQDTHRISKVQCVSWAIKGRQINFALSHNPTFVFSLCLQISSKGGSETHHQEGGYGLLYCLLPLISGRPIYIFRHIIIFSVPFLVPK